MRNQSENFKVLIVEDDESVQILISHHLRDYCNDITWASSADEAMGLLAEEKFDLIYLDLNLGEKWGTAVIDYLEQEYDNLNFHTPIIVASASLNQKFLRTYGRRVNTSLAKPLEKDDILDAFRNSITEIIESEAS